MGDLRLLGGQYGSAHNLAFVQMDLRSTCALRCVHCDVLALVLAHPMRGEKSAAGPLLPALWNAADGGSAKQAKGRGIKTAARR
jgi:hypothetical protein